MKRTWSVRVAIIATLVVSLAVLVAWAWLVWPTPWRYHTTRGIVLREHRWSGQMESLSARFGWRALEEPEAKRPSPLENAPADPLSLESLERNYQAARGQIIEGGWILKRESPVTRPEEPLGALFVVSVIMLALVAALPALVPLLRRRRFESGAGPLTAALAPGAATEDGTEAPALLDVLSVKALKAGWYLWWRIGLPLCFLLTALAAIVPLLKELSPHSRPYFAFLALLLYAVAIIWGVFGIWRLKHLVSSWARARYGRPLEGAVRWGIIWRAGVINVGIGIIATVIERRYTLGSGLVLDLMFLAVMALFLVTSIQALGWAMSVVVAKRFAEVGEEAPRVG